jgi:hypothetical protein
VGDTQKVILLKTGNNIASTARFTDFKIKLLEAMEKKDPAKAVKKLCVAESKGLATALDNLSKSTYTS